MDEALQDRLRRLLDETSLLERALGEERLDGDAVIAVRRLMDRCDLLFTRAINQFASTTSFRDIGYPNVEAWLTNEAHMHASEADTRRRMAATLDRFPTLAAALHEGDVTPGHVRLLANGLLRDHLPYAQRDEHILVGAARTFDPANFAKALRHWVACCDDERQDPLGPDLLEKKRSLRLFQLPDGSWRLDGTLTPLAGEALSTALLALGPKPSPDDPRTPTQRRHDTLDDLANQALSRGDRPDVGGERPHVTLMINATTGTAMTAAGTVLPAYLRDMVLCDASFLTVYFGANRNPVIVGAPTKEIPARNRNAVIARDLGCRMPGCGRPAAYCDVHHLEGRDGPDAHAVTKLALFCRYHHRVIHRWNLRLRLDTDGITLLIEWPNGIVQRSPPPGTLFAFSG